MNAAGITLWSSSAIRFWCAPSWRLVWLPARQSRGMCSLCRRRLWQQVLFQNRTLAVAIARKTAAVRGVIQSVTESMLTTRRHSARLRHQDGVKRDGTLVAREAEVFMDTGAYADNGPRVATKTSDQPLRAVPARSCKIDVVDVLHHTVPAGSMRSIGGRSRLGSGIAYGSLASNLASIHWNSHAPFAQARPGLKPGATAIALTCVKGCKHAIAPLNWQNRSRSKSQGVVWPRRVSIRSDAGFTGAGAFARRRQCHPARRHNRSGAGGADDAQPDRRRRISRRSTASAWVAPDNRPRRSTAPRRQRSTTVMGSAHQSRRRGFAQSIDSSRGRSLQTRVRTRSR